MGSGCRWYSMWEESVSGFLFTFHAISKSKNLASSSSSFFGLENSFKRCCGKKTLVKRAYMSDKVPEERIEGLGAPTSNQWYSVRNMFFCTKPTIHTSLYINNFHFFNSFLFFQAWKQILKNGNNQADLPSNQSRGRTQWAEKKRATQGQSSNPNLH